MIQMMMTCMTPQMIPGGLERNTLMCDFNRTSTFCLA